METSPKNPNSYPDGWLELYGSLAGDAAFVASARSDTRPSNELIVEDVDTLAGSLGKGNQTFSVDKIKAVGRRGITKAGSAGLEGKS